MCPVVEHSLYLHEQEMVDKEWRKKMTKGRTLETCWFKRTETAEKEYGFCMDDGHEIYTLSGTLVKLVYNWERAAIDVGLSSTLKLKPSEFGTGIQFTMVDMVDLENNKTTSPMSLFDNSSVITEPSKGERLHPSDAEIHDLLESFEEPTARWVIDFIKSKYPDIKDHFTKEALFSFKLSVAFWKLGYQAVGPEIALEVAKLLRTSHSATELADSVLVEMFNGHPKVIEAYDLDRWKW